MDPQITWYIDEEGTLVPQNDYYAGSVRPGQTLKVGTTIWNNRWGQTEAGVIPTGSKLVIYFSRIEDSVLLDYITVKIDGDGSDEGYIPPTIEARKGYISIPREVSGAVNDGSDIYINNYMRVMIKFGPVPTGLLNSAKNMLLDLHIS